MLLMGQGYCGNLIIKITSNVVNVRLLLIKYIKNCAVKDHKIDHKIVKNYFKKSLTTWVKVPVYRFKSIANDSSCKKIRCLI